MPSPAAIALSRLLPTLHPVPPRLLDTADSLLALSRQRASNLKADEEIARAHACAEIACSRLREKLRLPPVKAGTPPASAKTYKKLYGFLERVLGDDVDRLSATPGKRKREQMELSAPSKRVMAGLSPGETTSTRTPKGFVGKIKDASAKITEDEQEAPTFVMPAVRMLCRAFGTPEMIPHVYTGMCVVLGLSSLWPRPSLDEATEEDLEMTDEMFRANVMALIVAVHLMVLTRMMVGKMTRKMFKSISLKAMDLLEPLEHEKAVEMWVKRINKEGYAKGQGWWRSVPEGVFEFSVDQVEAAAAAAAAEGQVRSVNERAEEGGDEQLAGRVGREDLNLEPDPAGILLSGLGTMMQDAVDWTSEDRKTESEDWKNEMMERLDSMPLASGTVAVH